MGAQEVDAAPRKRPIQARSRATVDAILEGAIRILTRDGFDGATTTKIAEAAGVSVGSLYQYFPSKEAIVAALIEKHADELLAVFDVLMAKIADLPVREALPLIVDAAVDAHRIAPDLHKVLNEQVPRVGQMAQVERVSAKIADQIERYLAARRQEVGSKRDLKLAALVIEASVEAVVHRAIVQAPGYLGRELRDELVLMLDRYLAPPRKDGTPRQGGHHVGDGSGLRSHRERSGGATGGGSGAGSHGR